MNSIILQLFAVGFCFAVVQGLRCYKCTGFASLCVTSETTCESGEQCFSGTGKAAKVLELKMKGCLAVSKCNLTEDVHFPSTSNATLYSMTKMCCNTDLCNAAPGLPGTSGLSLGLATITALFMANILV